MLLTRCNVILMCGTECTRRTRILGCSTNILISFRFFCFFFFVLLLLLFVFDYVMFKIHTENEEQTQKKKIKKTKFHFHSVLLFCFKLFYLAAAINTVHKITFDKNFLSITSFVFLFIFNTFCLSTHLIIKILLPIDFFVCL